MIDIITSKETKKNEFFHDASASQIFEKIFERFLKDFNRFLREAHPTPFVPFVFFDVPPSHVRSAFPLSFRVFRVFRCSPFTCAKRIPPLSSFSCFSMFPLHMRAAHSLSPFVSFVSLDVPPSHARSAFHPFRPFRVFRCK